MEPLQKILDKENYEEIVYLLLVPVRKVSECPFASPHATESVVTKYVKQGIDGFSIVLNQKGPDAVQDGSFI